MSLLSDLAGDSVSIMGAGDLGLAALYQPHAGGAPISLNAIIEYQTDMSGVQMGQARIATIYVAYTDVARPAIYDEVSFTASGEVWQIQSVVTGGAGVWQLFAFSDRRAGA
jgi:hypothetical protein